jgi:general secretion pathway protein I
MINRPRAVSSVPLSRWTGEGLGVRGAGSDKRARLRTALTPGPSPVQRERGGSARARRHQGRPSFSGFTLLEVILALAILAGAVAVLGEVARQGLETARIARDLTSAQLICESIMSQITAGIVQPEAVDRAQVDAISDPNQAGWLYSIETEETDIDALISVRVTVTQDQPEARHPVHSSLVRWMQDPNATLTSGSSNSSSSGSSSGSSSSGSTTNQSTK